MQIQIRYYDNYRKNLVAWHKTKTGPEKLNPVKCCKNNKV